MISWEVALKGRFPTYILVFIINFEVRTLIAGRSRAPEADRTENTEDAPEMLLILTLSQVVAG